MGVKWGDLAHTHATEDKIRRNQFGQAERDHNAHLKAEMERARNGERVNLSDLMAAREVLAEPRLARRVY